MEAEWPKMLQMQLRNGDKKIMEAVQRAAGGVAIKKGRDWGPLASKQDVGVGR